MNYQYEIYPILSPLFYTRFSIAFRYVCLKDFYCLLRDQGSESPGWQSIILNIILFLSNLRKLETEPALQGEKKVSMLVWRCLHTLFRFLIISHLPRVSCLSDNVYGHAIQNILFCIRAGGGGADSIPRIGGGIFCQRMGSETTHHLEEFWQLMICSGNIGLESKQSLRNALKLAG